MKKIKVEDALGLILAHDITEIIPGKKKGVAFQRGKIIEKNDLEKLLDLGKRHIFIFDKNLKGIHENEAGIRIAESIMDSNMEYSSPKEGKIEIRSKVRGLFYVNARHLCEINMIPDVLLSTVPDRYPVKEGDLVAATRIIPVYTDEKTLKRVDRKGKKGIMSIKPFQCFKVGLVITGSEVFNGRVHDGSKVVEDKIRGYGLDLIGKKIVPDSIEAIRDAIDEMIDGGSDIVITTGGLSVDPDDVTREGIELTGAEVLFYGTPVFPGAMFLVAVVKGKYILGAPACVYYSKYTALDIFLPRIMANEKIQKKDVEKLAYGGLCLQCPVCHYPACFFGKGL